MTAWFIFLAAVLLITFSLRHDRESFRVAASITAVYVLVSVAIGFLNYVQLGRVIL